LLQSSQISLPCPELAIHAVNHLPFFSLQYILLCLSSFLFFASFNMLIAELPDYLTSLGGEDYKGLISLFTVTAGLPDL
jgi:hypothetical protein